MTRAIDTPTRDLAAALARRRSDRSNGTVAGFLTERDRGICLSLYEHRVLTTIQVYQLHFGSYARARTRLRQLYLLGLLARFRPASQVGSRPWHYVLDRLGLRVVAGRTEISVDHLHLRRDRLLELANSPRLAHMIQTRDFFCRLIHACRLDGSHRVSRWWGEARCAAAWDGLARPDGLGRLEALAGAVSFCLELDRGSEPTRRLEQKLGDYLEAASIFSDVPPILLFCFLTERRESSARRVLRGSSLTVATSTLPRHLDGPLEAVWLPVGSDMRLTLGELAEAGGRSS